MTPPQLLAIGNHTYTVALGKVRRGGRAHFGMTKAAKTAIWIDDTAAPSQVRDTYLHEVLHAVIADTPVRDAENEEVMVRAITPGLLAVLRSNPDLVKFLLED